MRDNCRQVDFYNFLMKVLMILNELYPKKSGVKFETKEY